MAVEPSALFRLFTTLSAVSPAAGSSGESLHLLRGPNRLAGAVQGDAVENRAHRNVSGPS